MSADSGNENTPTRKYIHPLDLYLKRRNPNHQFLSEEETIEMVLGNHPRHLLDEKWELFIQQCVKVMPKDDKPALADKPCEGDESLRYIRVPSSSYAIRIWSGEMEQYRVWCFDFYDANKKVAVNLPDDFTFVNASPGGVFSLVGLGSRVKSVEEACHMAREDIPPGEERYMAPEGSHLVLIRPGHEPLYFAFPVRPPPQSHMFAPLERSL